MIEKIAVILICILFSVAWGFRNAYQRQEVGAYIPQASKGWHLWEVVIKFCFAFVVALLTHDIFHSWFAFLMVVSIDFFFFPIVLNLRTGQHWGYVSKNGIDKYLYKIPNVLLLLIKLILLLISITYYLTNPYATNN